jgi:LEA14-like dessication related protein
MMESMRRTWIAIPLLALMASCTTVPQGFEAPIVTIADLTPKEMAIFEQRFDVKLRIQNPNDQDLSINGLRFDIQLNEHDFGNGMSGQRVAVPRFGSQVVDVEVLTTLASFLRQVQELNAGGGQRVRYRLKGTAFVDAPGTFKAPFDEKGEINLNLGGTSETAPSESSKNF